ncbi:hypothetical protein LZ023_20995 [Pseudomonas silvicola]|nr:hypothetical protein LZ023_20995 [Pseudomonas silvicola]
MKIDLTTTVIPFKCLRLVGLSFGEPKDADEHATNDSQNASPFEASYANPGAFGSWGAWTAGDSHTYSTARYTTHCIQQINTLTHQKEIVPQRCMHCISAMWKQF